MANLMVAVDLIFQHGVEWGTPSKSGHVTEGSKSATGCWQDHGRQPSRKCAPKVMKDFYCVQPKHLSVRPVHPTCGIPMIPVTMFWVGDAPIFAGYIPIATSEVSMFRNLHLPLLWAKFLSLLVESPFLYGKSESFVNYPLVIKHSELENHHVQWKNPLFLWQCPIVM